MKRILLLAAVATLFCGCTNLNRTEQIKAAKANNNIDVVADTLTSLGSVYRYYAIILKEQTKTSNLAIDTEGLSAEEKAEAAPTVVLAKLKEKPEEAAKDALADGKKDREEIEKSRDWGVFAWLKSGTFWGVVGAIGIAAARILLGGSKIGAPLVGLIDAFTKKIPIVGPAIDKGRAAIATAESSMAGRFALNVLDQMVGDKIKGDVERLTKGRASTIEDLFKLVSRDHAIDHEKVNHKDVEAFVDDLKDKMPSTGGMLNSVMAILSSGDKSPSA